MSPKVSVLMSVLNGERYLSEAVDSILNQTFTDFEFIVIDDGSTDTTPDILAEYAHRDHRMVIIQNKQNIGLTRSLNKGLALARGEYIARQDADDISLPHRLQLQASFLDHHPETVLISSNYEIIDEGGCQIKITQKLTDPILVTWGLLFANYVGGHGVVMFRRAPVINLGGYAEEYRYAQDYQLWSRLVGVGSITILPEVLLRWRSHKQSISTEQSPAQTGFALTVAQGNLKQLTGIQFDLGEVAALWHLWSGLPLANRNINLLHRHLNLIYQAFLAHSAEQGHNPEVLSRQLRSLISRQLLYCARASNPGRTLLLKLIVLPYALAWQPLTVLDYWLKVMQKIWSRKSLQPA